MKRDKLRKVFLYLTTALFVVILGYTIHQKVAMKNEHLIFSHSYTVKDESHNPANDYQYQNSSSEMILGVSNGKLIFLPHHDRSFVGGEGYAYWLTVLEDNRTRRLYEIDWNVLTFYHGYVYYFGASEGKVFADSLMAYHVETGEHRAVLAWKYYTDGHHNYYFVEDGILYVQKSPEESVYYPVTGFNVGEPIERAVCQVADGYYTIEEEWLYFYDSEGNRSQITTLEHWEMPRLMPCSAGVLIHSDGGQRPLYLLRPETNELIPLFEMECDFSCTAVNTYGEYAYMSVLRYRDISDYLNYKRYKNDTVEGTYRINLKDYSVEKINDCIFDCLYIFDDTGFYGVLEDGTVYKLDFDGKLQSVIIGRSGY